MLFLDDFDWLWILVNLWLTRAFWSIWLEMALWVVQRPNGLCHINLDVSTAPWRKDNIFWNFQGLAPKLRANKVWCQLLPLLYLTSLVQWEVSDKECDFTFCCPKIVCENSVVHGSRPVLPNTVELIWIFYFYFYYYFFFLIWSSKFRQETLIFFFLAQRLTSQHWLGQCWPATLVGALGRLSGPSRCAGKPSP